MKVEDIQNKFTQILNTVLSVMWTIGIVCNILLIFNIIIFYTNITKQDSFSFRFNHIWV